MNVSRSRHHAPRLLLTTLLLALAFSSPADVVLLPGQLVGQVGLDGWTFHGSSVTLTGNAAGYSARLSFSGPSFLLTAEGNQSYKLLRLSHSFSGGTFELMSSTPYEIRAHESVEVDLRRPAGTLISRIQLTGGWLTRSLHSARASNSVLSERYSARMNTGGREARLPMVAGDAIMVGGSATISVMGEGDTVLCTITMSFPGQTVSLTRGATVTVTHKLNVSEENCRGGAAMLSGTVALDGLPAGIDFSRAEVSMSDQTRNVTPDAPEFSFSGLAAGRYSLQVETYFNPPPGTNSPSGMLHLPLNPATVEVGEEGEVVRDIRYTGIPVNGTFITEGYAMANIKANSILTSGISDPSVPGGGPTTGGSARFNFEKPTSRNFQVVLTPGKWRMPEAFFSFADTMNSVSLRYVVDRPNLMVPESGSLSIPSVTLKNSSAFVYFDVAEKDESDTDKLISSPRISAYRTHPTDMDTAYVEASRKVSDKPKPSVLLIGPRGTYTVNAYAIVDRSSVRFPSTTVELGTSAVTAEGSGVLVALEDGLGAPLPITLRFDNVVQEGETSASLTNMGPEPAEGYELLEVVGGARFMSLNSTATLDGKVSLTVTYDPMAIGLTPEQESELELHQFVCEGEGEDEHCDWEPISSLPLQGSTFGCGTVSPANPDLLRHEITGRTSTLGLVALALPKEVAQPPHRPPQVTCVGSPDAPVRLETSPSTCGLLVGVASRLAGDCTAGSAALDSCTLGGQDALLLGPGFHPVTLTASASDGQTASCTSYLTVVDVEPPQVSCPAPQILECTDQPMEVALQPSCSDNCEGCVAACEGSGSFSLGTHVVSCSAMDTSGYRSMCETSVTIADSVPPQVRVTATPAVLWPPNHELRPVLLQVDVVDVCDPRPGISCQVTSNESDDSGGDGHTSGDVEWREGKFWLRAERSGLGNGRVYTITCIVTDASGNKESGITRVLVPKSMESSSR